MFPDPEMVRGLQSELDTVIQLGVAHITQLLRDSDMRIPFTLEDELEKSPPSPLRRFGKLLVFLQNRDGYWK